MPLITRTSKQIWYTLWLIGAVFFFYLFYTSVKTYSHLSNYNLVFFLVFILFILLFIISKYLLKVKNKWLIPVLLFICACIPRLVFIMIYKPIPTGDFHYYYNMASEWLANGTYDGTHLNFPEILSFVKYQYWIMRLFGTGALTQQVIYCAATSLISPLLYFMLKNHNRQVGFIAAVFWALYPSNIIFCGVLSNQHLSALLFYAAFACVLLESDSRWKSILYITAAGILLGLGQLIRAEGPPLLIAVILFLIFRTIIRIYKKNLKRRVLHILSPLIVFTAFFAVISVFFYPLYLGGITNKPLPSSDIRYKIFIGMNFDTKGIFTIEDCDDFMSADDAKKAQMVTDRIKYAIDHPFAFLDLVRKKMYLQYVKNDYAYFWAQNGRISELSGLEAAHTATQDQRSELAALKHGIKTEQTIDQPIYALFLLFAALGCLLNRKNLLDGPYPLLLFVLLCHVGIYFIIEAQERYQYLDLPAIYILSAYGIVSLCKYFTSWKRL